MVNKSDWLFATIYGNAAYNMACSLPVVDIKESVTIDYRIVFHFKTFYSIDCINHIVVGFLHGVTLDIVETCLHCLVDFWRDGLLIVSKKRVARRAC